MIEIIMFCLLAIAVVACLPPLLRRFNTAKLAGQLAIPEDSVLRRHFLTQVRSEDAMLAAELEKRLAKAR